jgi:hypothetical protein
MSPTRDAGEVAGRPASELGYWLALAVTAGADVAAFNQIVSLVMSDQSAWIVALMVAGFTSCSLTLAHFAGRLAGDISRGHGTAKQRQVVMLVIPWAVLGAVAFAVRLAAAFDAGTSVGGQTIGGGLTAQTRHATAALLFLVLYLASGAVAGFGVYLTRNPKRVAYRRARRAYERALRHLARSQPAYERALQVLRQHARTSLREEGNYQAAVAQRLAFAGELKRYAAVLIAAQLQDPSVTDGMTLPDRWPMQVPPPPEDRPAQPSTPLRAATLPVSPRHPAANGA